MAISDTITSMYENVGNVYDVLELAGADLTNVDKNIQNLKQSWEERLLYFLANGTDTLWNNWLPKVTGTGETITLNNTIEAKMDFVYKGNTSQYSTTGKNLCYFSNYTEYGATFNGSEIKVVNPNGTAYAGNNFNLQYDTSKSGKTYTIYICVNGTKETGAIGKAISINVAKTNNTTAARVLLPSDTGTFNNFVSVDTITLAQDEVFRNVYVVVNNSITANLNVKLMIVEGSYTAQTIGDYEPYTNGASPNPDYPQDIQVVSGDNTIKVAGKNLFDISTITENKTIDLDTGEVNVNANNRNTSDFIFVTNSVTYSCNVTMTRIAFYDENKTFISSSAVVTSIVTPNNCNYVRFSYDNSLSNIQFERGLSTEFTPYAKSYPINLGDIELCKIGNCQDYIEKNTGKNLFDNDYANNSSIYTIIIEAENPLGTVNCYELQLKPNTTYTLSINMNGYAKVNSWLAGLCYADGTFISYLQYGTMSEITTKTFITDNTGKIYVGQRYGLSSNDRMPLFLETALIQIEENDRATEYEHYGEKGNWYKYSAIGKVVLDGSENWQSASSVVSGTSRFYYDDNKYMNNNVGSAVNAISDKFKAISWQQIFADDTTTKNAISTWASDTYEGRLVIRIDSSLASSVETFKTWLSTHNTTVYYVLAKSTYTKITDTTLISQLEAIKKSYNTQTNISQENNDLPFELDVVALGELEI